MQYSAGSILNVFYIDLVEMHTLAQGLFIQFVEVLQFYIPVENSGGCLIAVRIVRKASSY
jgi:hypothetical protein